MSARIGIQLYTLRREESPRALPVVLERLRALGYDGVEPAGLWGVSAREFRRRCDAAGLLIPATHLNFAPERDFACALEAAAELGLDSVVIPQIEEIQSGDPDAVWRAADALNRLSTVAAGFGLSLGYHNHEWEYARMLQGRSVHRWLFDALAPAIFAEVDVYWAQVGGADPVEEITRLGARARMLHLKDGPARDVEADMCALGEGNVDLRRILERSRATWHVVEIDHTSGDLWEAIARSRVYLTDDGSPTEV